MAGVRAIAGMPVFVERFALGVCVGAAAICATPPANAWAASLAFSGFALFLVFRWARLVRDPWIDEDRRTR
ncbi:hypothetical protein ASC76_18545 [Rhizobacter sp. Root404]|nr:hypothetical protein ASC76_18545 [Rhizobacter sp. Root404]